MTFEIANFLAKLRKGQVGRDRVSFRCAFLRLERQGTCLASNGGHGLAGVGAEPQARAGLLGRTGRIPRSADGHADGRPGATAKRQDHGPRRHLAPPAQLVDRSVQPPAAHGGHADRRRRPQAAHSGETRSCCDG